MGSQNVYITEDERFTITVVNDDEFTVSFVQGSGLKMSIGTTAPVNPTVNEIWIDTN